jgi:23S rRNA (cytidine1920-2'-O)/16S rRNA (cytidine1409-2'-O)-methyltransferase
MASPPRVSLSRPERLNAAKPRKIRLDQLIVERGLVSTRSRAQALLMAGRVRVGAGDAARRDRRPGEPVATDIEIEIESGPRYVSRGGEKLAGALDAFGVDPSGRVCLDVGASTGGFSDCLLQRGARRVYALDVGRGQLAESLRQDERVVSMERTHAIRLDPGSDDPLELPERAGLVVADVSFISLTRLLRGMAAHTEPGGDILPMVKPQFELSPAQVPKGVVRDPDARAQAVARVRDHALGLGLEVVAEAESVLVGPSGNHEFFLHLRVPSEQGA